MTPEVFEVLSDGEGDGQQATQPHHYSHSAAELAPPPPSHPQRSVSTDTHKALREVASECVCPISKALMIDPVIASYGLTYDRISIETWFDELTNANKELVSPQTRETMTRHLLPNLALRRTIEHLVESGRLALEITEEWHESKKAAAESALKRAHDRNLARFPLGCSVWLTVKLHQVLGIAEEVVDDIVVDVYVAKPCARSSWRNDHEVGRLLFKTLSPGMCFGLWNRH